MVAIPAYNEERYIGSLVLRARQLGLTVLVVDDGSTDQTAEIAAAAGALVERHAVNRGKAAALNTAFRVARSRQAEVLVVLDGDSQHDVQQIEPLIAPIHSGEADIVVGSRFLPESNGAIPGLRRLGQRAMTLLTNAGSGVQLTDSQSGFRAFSRRAVETILFQTSGFSAEVEMQFLARQHALRLREVPISASYFDPPKRNAFRHGAQVLHGVLSLIGRHRPLLFFGSLGLLFGLIGLSFGILVTSIYQAHRILAVGYSLITVLCLIVGLLALFTAIVLHSIRSSFLDVERRLASLERGPSSSQDLAG
jgi:glycosyltransferase involved in cell wall biosynthesis